LCFVVYVFIDDWHDLTQGGSGGVEMEEDSPRDKAESALQTTALDEPCEYPAGRVKKKKVERRMRSAALKPRLPDNFESMRQSEFARS
jgi:hypothetical protein